MTASHNKAKSIKSILLIISILIILIIAGCDNDEPKESTIEETSAIEPESKEIKLDMLSKAEHYYSLKSKLSIENYLVDSAEFYDEDTILVTQRSKEGSKQILTLFDIYQGSVLSQINIDTADEVFLNAEIGSNGNIYLIGLSGNIKVYNNHLELVDEMNTGLEQSPSLFDKKNNLIYFIVSKEEFQICQYNLINKQEDVVYTFNEIYSAVTFDGIIESKNILLLNSYDLEGNDSSMYFYVDTKELKDTGSSKYNRLVSGDNILSWMYDSNIITWIDINKSRVITNFALESKIENTCMAYDKSKRYIITAEYSTENSAATAGESEYIIRFYDTDKQILLYTMNMGNIANSYEFASFDSGINNLLLIKISTDETTDLLIWDYSRVIGRETEEDSTGSNNYYAIGGDKTANDKLIKKIESKYGIIIKTRNNAVRFFSDFAVTPISDETLIDMALQTIDSLFAQFPEGFFKEFVYGDIKGLELYLCGTLVQGAEEGTSTPVAFALQDDNKQILVVDINSGGDIRRNISHELFHAMESKVDYLTWNSGITGFDDLEWSKLNPKDFKYHNSYVNENKEDYSLMTDQKYTIDTETIENVYFVDSYSTTFVYEDRARIFEYLMGTSLGDSLPEVFESSHIKAKADYIFKVLREAFPSVRDATDIYWEKKETFY